MDSNTTTNTYTYTNANTNAYPGTYNRPPTPEEWRLRRERTVGSAASRIGLGLCLMLIVADFLPAVPIGFLGYMVELSKLALLGITTAVQYLVAMPVYFAIVKGMPKQLPRKQKISVGQLGVCFLMCMPLLYGGSYLGEGTSRLIIWLTGLPVPDALNETISDMPIFLILLLTVILAPIMEELVFRKVLLDRLGMYGALPAAVFSGLVFGLYHGNFYQFFYAFFIGIFFAVVYLKSGRIGNTILLHMAINFVGAFLPSLLELVENDWVYQLLGVLQFILLMGILLTGIVLLIVYRKRFRLEEAPAQIPIGQEYRFFWNAGSVFYYLLCAFCFILMLL